MPLHPTPQIPRCTRGNGSLFHIKMTCYPSGAPQIFVNKCLLSLCGSSVQAFLLAERSKARELGLMGKSSKVMEHKLAEVQRKVSVSALGQA